MTAAPRRDGAIDLDKCLAFVAMHGATYDVNPDAARAEVEGLRGRVARYEKALRSIEWRGIRFMETAGGLPIYQPPDDACLMCRGVKPGAYGWPATEIGHKEWCEIRAALDGNGDQDART